MMSWYASQGWQRRSQLIMYKNDCTWGWNDMISQSPNQVSCTIFSLEASYDVVYS